MDNTAIVPIEFRCKFFIDTNILVYLVDKSFDTLSKFLDIAKESPFVDLVSSEYVLFEFVGVRKKEHYLRKAFSKISQNNDVNFSTLIKYAAEFSYPNISLEDVIEDIERSVKTEIDQIVIEYGIDYSYSHVHSDQLLPTFDVCLSSKISTQDSFVLISSILPRLKEDSFATILLTNDKDFSNSTENPRVKTIFDKFNFKIPVVQYIKNINNIDLTKNNLEDLTKNAFNFIVLEQIQNQNKGLFLGKTFMPNSLPNDIICFKAKVGTEIPENVYITIIQKDLNFLYTSKKIVKNFRLNNTIIGGGYVVPSNANNNFSCKIVEVDEAGNDKPPSTELINSIREEGNYVFVHPDSF